MVSALDPGASGPDSSPDWGQSGDIVMCSWARHLTLTVPLSTQVYKGVAREWSWGARDPPPFVSLFVSKQTTHNIQVTIW